MFSRLKHINSYIHALIKPIGIKQLVVLSSLLPAIAIAIFLSIYFNVIRNKDLYNEVNTKGSAIVSRLCSLGKHEILDANLNILTKILKQTINKEIIGASFFDVRGNLLATAGKQNINLIANLLASKQNINECDMFFTITKETKDSLIFSSPISLSKTCTMYDTSNINSIPLNSRVIIGWSQIEIAKLPTQIKAYTALCNSLIVTLLGIIISTLMAIKLGKKVTEPIFALSQAVEKISNGELNTTLNTKAKWELAILESGIRSMTLALKNFHGKMQRNIKSATITLRKQNIELEIARKKAEYASKVKSKFLTNISHQLRTPLNSITGFINVLQKTKLDKWQLGYLDNINKSSLYLLNIINNILDFSKVRYGKLRLNNETFNIRDCIDDALNEISFLAHNKQLELINLIAPNIPQQVQLDNARLKQIISNLISILIKIINNENIIISTSILDNNTTTNTISICCNISNHFISTDSISINDHKKYHSNIKYPHGMGINLSICNKIITRMGGALYINFNPLHQYSFMFTIVAKKNIAENTIKSTPSLQLPQLKVLLIDSNPIVLQSISSMLAEWNLSCETMILTENLIDDIKTGYSHTKNFNIILIGLNAQLTNKDLDLAMNKTIFAELKKSFSCYLGVLSNTTDYLIHNYIIKLGADICLAKPVSYQKLYYALCKLFTPESKQLIMSTNLHELSILVVDDNHLNLEIITTFLKNININTVAVNNGTKALNIIRNQTFHIIFMDILMPDINGIQVANIIRTTNNPNKNSIIITLSAHMLLSEQELLKTAGINDYLTKPINENQLKSIIYKWTRYKNISEHKHLQDHNALIKNIPSIDWKLSLKLASGKSKLAKNLFAMMISNLPDDKDLINTAFQINNLENLREHVHKLHGSCCYTGFAKLKYITKNLEQQIIFKNHQQIKKYINYINDEIDYLLLNYKKLQLQNHH
jgi:two-component system sensor histidine kinase BarA